ncbi:MAG: hypothetical protein H6727_00120 [Myxococcales bacterium]|nr:hypothetical protein [Myxococcales bacterium]
MYRTDRWQRLALHVLMFAFVWFSWGCGVDYAPERDAASLEVAPEPDKMGPFTVGVRTIKIVDTTRKTDKYPEGRPLVIDIWYPAMPQKEDAVKDAYDPKADAPKETIDKLVSEGINIPKLAQDAYRDAEPYKKGGPYPLILYSHGSGGIRYQSVFQCPHLASHGYVVAAVDHVDNTLYDILAGNDARDTGILLQSATDRPIDQVKVWNEMKSRNANSADPLFQMMEPENVGITGHSFGGFTSVLTPRDLPALKVSIPQAPFTSLVEDLGVKPEHLAKLPIMVLASKADMTLDYAKEQRGFYEKMLLSKWFSAPRYLVTLERGGHFTFSNMCDLDLGANAVKLGFKKPEDLINDGCSEQNVKPLEGHRLTNYYATALFNAVLRKSEKSRAFLKQVEGNEAVFETKAP